jgi:signal transduction histidine kinase
MVRKSPLRWRILLFTAIPMVVLALGTLWVVERTVSRQVHDNVEQDLRRAAAVFEDMLGERAEQLRIASDVIVRDPRFFSVLTLPGSHRDAVYRNTVAGVAADFNAITHADLFDVFDAHGVLVASAGRDRAPGAGGEVFERALRERKATQGVIVVGDRPFQVTITPVIAGGRVVGVLRVGARIGQELAGKLRDLTRSDVSFVSGGTMSGSTLADPAARSALLAAAGPDAREMFDLEGGATGTNLTLVRLIPGTSDASGPRYAIQRSLRAETAFLGEIQAGLSQLGLLAILVAVIAGLMIAERITRPLQRIVRAAEEIERGNYDYPIGDKSPDEIGYLARRFDDMRQHERAYVHSLEEVARLKSEFISVASHELRTPISVIRGFQELLVDAMLGPVNEQQKKALVAIGEGTDSLLKIADDATRIAQIEGERIVLAPDDHDVSDLLKAATHDALEEARGRQVTVTLETDRSMPRILVDGPRLSEAVSNLVKNGLRFTPDGGRVDVRAWWRDEELEIEVADDGIGIDPDHLPHVFDRGFVVRGSRNHHSSNTLEFNSAGLGLGLAIARGIVEAHGGTIEVESTPEKGSRFVIRMRPERAEVWRNAA